MVLVFGSWISVCLSANKVPGIRAMRCHDTYSVSQAANLTMHRSSP
ncbi:RpiB/LacA/LacB family sugar-phosphate isomerase [Paracoccaceae bacterium]|nr:RpiB/LacA/LacB family sugar-phosphate isomerase [Paracoccaceae bacterium]